MPCGAAAEIARRTLVDAAASAPGPENEAALARAVVGLGDDPERTVIVIARPPATPAGADRVVSLGGGRITGSGTPGELPRAGGASARLSRRYERARHRRVDSAAGGRRRSPRRPRPPALVAHDLQLPWQRSMTVS
ncbi:hypothetical protein [Streptomyces sp. NPDC001889]